VQSTEGPGVAVGDDDVGDAVGEGDGDAVGVDVGESATLTQM
jgi:hypothetical protein